MKLKIKGAIDKDNNYIFPHNGIKKEKYTCPDCNEDIIFKKGEIVTPYFSHKSHSNCTYLNGSPSESEIHIYAKNKLAQWLEEKKKLKILVSCTSCNEQFVNKKIKYKDGDEVIIEYNSPCRKYVADVAIINNGKVRYVLEVTNTHKTIDEAAEVRPEPWFDFNAMDIINDMDFDKNKSKLSCIRNECVHTCEKCDVCVKEEKKKVLQQIEKIKCEKIEKINKAIEECKRSYCKVDMDWMYEDNKSQNNRIKALYTELKFVENNIEYSGYGNNIYQIIHPLSKQIVKFSSKNKLFVNGKWIYVVFSDVKKWYNNDTNNKNEDYKLFYPICDKSN